MLIRMSFGSNFNVFILFFLNSVECSKNSKWLDQRTLIVIMLNLNHLLKSNSHFEVNIIVCGLFQFTFWSDVNNTMNDVSWLL